MVAALPFRGKFEKNIRYTANIRYILNSESPAISPDMPKTPLRAGEGCTKGGERMNTPRPP
jgi:hypothetical protein